MTTETTPYDVVIAVSYYAPYVSGLTEVARIEAEGLAASGYRVAVVTTQHDKELPQREDRAGVDVYRCPVLLRVGRGALAPAYTRTVVRLAKRARTLHLHAPMLECGAIAALATRHTRVVLTHHIDLWVPRTLLSPLAVAATNASTAIAMKKADLVIVNSDDQAHGSRLWPRIEAAAWQAIPAPCADRRSGSAAYRTSPGPHYGFLGRIVEDKGLKFLIDAFARHTDPDARLLIGGESVDVAGGSTMSELERSIAADPRIHVLGMLRGRQLDDFYASIDVFTLPSIAESFGIVQAEAIMTGRPSITTDIPGGRYPVAWSGLGALVQPGDVDGLAAALREQPSAHSPHAREQAARRARDAFGVDEFLRKHRDALGLVCADAAK